MVDTLARWEFGAEELEKLEELGSKGGVDWILILELVSGCRLRVMMSLGFSVVVGYSPGFLRFRKEHFNN